MIEQISPIKSKIVIYDLVSWGEFLKSQKPSETIEGVYYPRKLTAHLKADTQFFEINKFHEYFGHGSFCEHSRIGKRIVNYEQELVGIEKQILGVNELPENLHFQVRSDNPYFKQYAILKKEFGLFLAQHHVSYEGFAYWLEKQLALENGLEGVYREREQLICPQHTGLVKIFEEFVTQNSVAALLEKLGFE